MTQWRPDWVRMETQMLQMLGNHRTNEKQRAPESTRNTQIKKDDKHIPSKGSIVWSCRHGSTVFTFRPLLQKVFQRHPKSSWYEDPEDPLNQKDCRRDVYRACSNIPYTKTTKCIPNGTLNRKPRSPCVFYVFEVPSPGWAPGRPRTGSKAQKHTKMEPPSRIFENF